MNWRYKTPCDHSASRQETGFNSSQPASVARFLSFVFAVSIFVFKFTVKLTDEL